MLGFKVNGSVIAVMIALAAVPASWGIASAQSDPVEDFYRNKQVRFITGYSAGGLFDTATRIFSCHLGKFIPGRPNMWVDNITGAGGLIATNYLAKHCSG